MTGPEREELRRLHFINALFSRVTGHDLYLANQIKAAIAFSLAELEARVAAEPESAAYESAFTAAAAQLLEKFCRDLPRHGFFHWDAARTLHSATPLFARAELMAGLKQLAPHPESTLLITNLRPALVPPERRATPRRVRDYDEALAFIRQLAAERTTRSARLQLLFL
ncbi:MAG TPA: hypothetical protein VHV47_13895 [Opitutaceae bacterium]|jgi:hypothetical protein|nr:hypothetical protein [Opitutaceae bacterium]